MLRLVKVPFGHWTVSKPNGCRSYVEPMSELGRAHPSINGKQYIGRLFSGLDNDKYFVEVK